LFLLKFKNSFLKVEEKLFLLKFLLGFFIVCVYCSMLLGRDQDRVDISPQDFWSVNVQIENFDINVWWNCNEIIHSSMNFLWVCSLVWNLSLKFQLFLSKFSKIIQFSLSKFSKIIQFSSFSEQAYLFEFKALLCLFLIIAECI